ncbi:MAG TPA: DNA repair protein RadC [Candidatus Polarisedimenticolia bacterium]
MPSAVRVSDLPRGLQPREKLLKHGERALSNSELMAVVLGSGTRSESVIRIADGLLRKYGFDALPNISLNEWRTNRGIGTVKACQLRAAFELGRRAFAPKDDERPSLSSPREAYAQVKDLRRARKEHLVALYLDAQNHLIARETISIGGLNTTRTHPREILQPAIACSALGFILVHNHPSGSLSASQDDVDFTRAIKRASEIIGIGLYDHIIVSSNGFVSLKEKGLL